MVATLENLSIGSAVLPLSSLHVEFDKSPRECRSRHEIDLNTRIVVPDGRRMRVSDRFWSSFSSLQNLGRSVFDYFSHAEVFARITERAKTPVRVSFEETADCQHGRMLSCTGPGKPLLRLDEVRDLVEEYQGGSLSYADGVVTATFECPFPSNFKVGGDDFRTQFNLAMPVDGYGLPAAFLALLRLVCSNGMVAMAPAFKTAFQLGKDSLSLVGLLHRAMETFNNEEGFHALRQRVESASGSWASLNEAKKLQGCLASAALADAMEPQRRTQILADLSKACGDPLGLYGLSGHDEVSVRRARSIPVEQTIYGLMNFASEAATHHFRSLHARNRVNAWIGETVTQEFDLEGTVSQFPDFQDYFLARGKTSACISSGPADAARTN